MSYLLTLLCSDTPLSIAHIESAEKFIEERGLGLNGKPVWMAPHKAARIPVQNLPAMDVMKALRGLFAADRIDVLCIRENAGTRLFLADMDATIVEGETLDDLAAKAGIKDQISAITARAMNGDLDFKAALRERVGLLKGLPVSALEETLAETHLNPGAAALLAGLKAQHITCVLVSGGFQFFTGAIANRAGFDHNHGNILNHDGWTLDGTVGEPILDKDSKLAYLKSYAQNLEIDLAQTMAIGDGANDLPMLAAAGIGIGYRPKPVLEENLLNVLKYADLDALLYLTAA